jgi:hypothetical protein
MSGKRGAPAGNRNAAGRHTGITGAVGRTLGLRQLTPKDSAAINAIVSGAKARQSTLSRITGMPVKVTEQEWQKIINIQKKSKPW